MKKSSMILLTLFTTLLLSGCVNSSPVWVKDEPAAKPPVAEPAVVPPPVSQPAAAPPVAAVPPVEEKPVVNPVKPDSKVWEFLGRTKSGDTYYNKTAIPVSPDIISVSTYKIVTDDFRSQTIEEIKKFSLKQSVKYKRYEHNVRVDEIDCTNKRYRVKRVTHFDDQGNVLDDYTYENEGWKNIPVLTELDTLREKLCVPKKKSMKKKR